MRFLWGGADGLVFLLRVEGVAAVAVPSVSVFFLFRLLWQSPFGLEKMETISTRAKMFQAMYPCCGKV